MHMQVVEHRRSHLWVTRRQEIVDHHHATVVEQPVGQCQIVRAGDAGVLAVDVHPAAAAGQRQQFLGSGSCRERQGWQTMPSCGVGASMARTASSRYGSTRTSCSSGAQVQAGHRRRLAVIDADLERVRPDPLRLWKASRQSQITADSSVNQPGSGA